MRELIFQGYSFAGTLCLHPCESNNQYHPSLRNWVVRETKCIRPSNATLFALMWAIYLLIHQLKQTPWPTHVPISLGVVRVAMVGVAIAFLCRPRKAAWFCAMVGLQVASVTIELPVMSNCWLFTGIVNFGILASIESQV